MQHDADAAENNNNGYNPNDPILTATLIQSINKVTIITIGKVTGVHNKLNKETTLTTQMLTKVHKATIHTITTIIIEQITKLKATTQIMVEV